MRSACSCSYAAHGHVISVQVLLLHPGYATVVDAHTGSELERIALPLTQSKVGSIAGLTRHAGLAWAGWGVTGKRSGFGHEELL